MTDSHPPLSILLVEDHADTACVIAKVLETMGHSVEAIATVEDAVKAVVERQFDLIISDVGLPDGSGVSLIHGIRPFCEAPAIALTAYDSEEDIALCLRAGFDLHLAKPASPADLHEAIQAALRARAKHPQAQRFRKR
jgi:CheY-like chemotaxis protein